MDAVSAWVGTLAWSVYLGGVIVMEVVWRPAQEHLPPSQTAVACAVMGRRFRWFALGALAVSGAAALVRVIGSAPGPSAGDPAGRAVAAALVGWCALVALVAYTTVVAHPALHRRAAGHASDEERAAARARVGRAIRRMDRVVRVELAVAFATTLLVASVPAGGLW